MARRNHRQLGLDCNKRAAAVAAITGTCAIFASTGHAAIVGGELTGGTAATAGGSFQTIAAPALLDNNQYQDNNVRAFDEVQDLTLAGDFIMDFGAPDFASNVVAAGSVVSSHYLIFDPDGMESAVGSVTFDKPVIGVITSNLRFNGSDGVVGNPATTYAIGSQSLDPNDAFTIAGNTVNYDITANSPGDAIRIITSSNATSGINVCGEPDITLTAVITGGDSLDNGGQFRQICAPIGDVGNDNFDSFDLFAFEEQQAVELVEDLFLDAITIVPAGEFVSSYYVVWDPVPTNRVQATITFPDTVIGVISDRPQLEDSEFLGNASANYLNPSQLGLEPNDGFTIDGDSVSVNFVAGSPGDSIRVILGSASPSLSYNICEPQDMTLSGTVTSGQAATDGGIFSQLCEPIGPVGNDNQQANDLFAFEEAINVTLQDAIELDDPALATIAAGTIVSTYYVAFDPASNKDVVGSITFPGDVLGIATTSVRLTSSDSLGNPSATYLNPGLRGLESDDFASFSGDTVSVDFTADSPGDYIRVFIGVVDSDGDGITDDSDNCILVANTDQLDTNGDGIGNACDPDLNNDCEINFSDLAELKAVFFTNDADADFTGDSVVNFLDLTVLKAMFFTAPGPAADPNDCT